MYGLAKNNLNPVDLSQKIKKLIKKNLRDFSDVEVAGPGFLNINLSDEAIIININKIFKENNA